MTAKTNRAVTRNGAATNATSENPVLDLFFVAGASRTMSDIDVINMFRSAWAHNPDLATRVGLWARDARGGAGERRAFRLMFKTLIEIDPDRAQRVLARIPELGRWDDVLVALETPLADQAIAMVKEALHAGDRLCAKWMPRQGLTARQLRDALGWSPKRWRKTLVTLTQVVETQMCERRWDEIDFGSVPSVAHARYRRAFRKHVPEYYEAFLADVRVGERTINAGAVFPHDVIRDRGAGANEQWAALPNYMEHNDETIIPLVDVSGSMSLAVSGSVTAMDVAVGLGLYVSERNKGPFQNAFITFSSQPKIQYAAGDIVRRYQTMARADWGMSTNVHSAARLILDTARHHQVPADQMPSTLMVLSDMEFDQANQGGTAFEALETLYREYGYAMPRVVWWNINGRSGNVPVSQNQAGATLISGFSPAILKAVLAGQATPLDTMMEAIGVDRYNF